MQGMPRSIVYACAHDEVEGYIQPNIDPHQLRHHLMVRVYKVLYELFYGIIVMHTIINDATLLINYC
jgi:hypothetical protein